MSGQITPSDIAGRLLNLAYDLSALVGQIDVAEREAVHAREDYTLSLSRAFLAATGPMDVRKHESIAATHTERLAAELAEAIVRGLRRQIDSCKVRIDVGRSVGTTVRSEMNLAGRDGTP